MIGNKKILAIIPARGGSKGLPGKNIRLLNGKPLIVHTIEAALKSKYIDKVIVSTDDSEIMNISKLYGAEVPFLRPKKLATDNSSSIDVVIHCIKWLQNNECKSYDYICLLQCTSPIRNVNHIDESIELLNDENIDSIVSLTEVEESPYWMKIIDNGRVKPLLQNNNEYTRRQDLPKVYKLNGAIYINSCNDILENKRLYSNEAMPFVMDLEHSMDIDTLEDFVCVENYLIKNV